VSATGFRIETSRAASAGCASFDELQFELSVATACGKCLDCARQTFASLSSPCEGATGSPRCDGHCRPERAVHLLAPARSDAAASATA